ncbi:MAG: CbiX/SirB N-terminal domain-containing protein [Pseudomonadota bacterium]
MHVLLVIAHGSRRCESNNEIRQFVKNIAQHGRNAFDSTRVAFLELAEPSIETAVDECVHDGASQITVVPYFLSAGYHVARDVPEILAAKQTQYAKVPINTKAYIGRSAEMIDLVIDAALD